jgi:polyisoprenoid-binding protein YceI
MGARMQSLGGVLTAQVLATHLYAELPLVSLSAASVHQGRVVYRIDQDLGPIGLVINECGVFAVRGALERFSGTLVLDRADRLDARLDLALDAASVALSGQEGLNWQPLAPRFDVAAHPMIRFRTSAVAPAGRGRFEVRGLLEIGGVTRLQTLIGVLDGRRANPVTGTEVVDLAITGCLAYSAFGMQRDQMLISDRVELRISARMELAG